MPSILLSPLARKLGLIAVILGLALTIYQVGRSDGKQAVITKIEEARDLAVDEIEEIRNDVESDANLVDRANRWLRPPSGG
jgi:hypothetical protein